MSSACTVLKLNFNWGRMNVGYGHVCFESYVVDEIKNGIFVFQGLFMDDSLCCWKSCICWFYSHSAMFSLHVLCMKKYVKINTQHG